MLAIDQFRGDYIERFGGQLTGGIGRMARSGAWFTNAHHDHAITETAPGHATLLAGRFPRSTGIAANRVGVDDESSPLLAGAIGVGASPRRFIGTTLADWLRATDARTRVFSLSSKDRAAILPIGRSRSDVYWYSTNGHFTTSTYYRDSLPHWVREWNNRRLPQSYASQIWDILLPDSAYHEPDSVSAEAGGRGFVFPYGLPDDTLSATNIVRSTPFIDDITLSFALHGLEALRLGRGEQTDLISISLSGTDYIGHRFGPDSREMHDQVVRVDRAIGAFLDSLYRVRDSASVTIVFSSDHGVARIPEVAGMTMKPAPFRVSLAPLFPELSAGLRAAGIDTMAIDVDQQIVTFDRAAFKLVGANVDSAITAFAAAASAVPGVKRVDRFRQILADTATDPIARRWSHQFPGDAAIDLVVTLLPQSTWRGNVASHGSPYDYDSHVPLIFSGAGVKPGRHAEFVRTVDLAPTLAQIIGIKPMEKLDGVALTSAVR